ncbi:MAG: peptidase M23 [Euryarchaeota archaeon]|nr:peptidase M23 [Euryarchaeota archaeon]|tara:strand:+ start:72 stop:635 length:564 start_codon:yes stop_codon:yes gene_type:complete
MAEVIILPDEYWVFDFTKGPQEDFECPFAYQIGRYDEVRPGMYTHELFGGDRDLHVGIDIGAPVGEPVHAFSPGVVFSMGINPEDGSYGPTIIIQHEINGKPIWALYGHLSMESLEMVEQGMAVEEGQIIGTVGDKAVNGGWPPHLHFQLSWEAPECNDMPGVVARRDRDWALEKYPDPRMVLGPLY